MYLNKRGHQFSTNPKRVVLKPFRVGVEQQYKRLIEYVYKLSEDQCQRILNSVLQRFENRHQNFRQKLFNQFEKVKDLVSRGDSLSDQKKLLMGSFFSHEFSIQAAALFNPSIVEAPHQGGNEKEKSIIMSLRSVGENHISSIEFREGVINEEGDISWQPVSQYSELPHIDKSKNGYTATFCADTELSARVIFPVLSEERKGLEDARFVRFTDENGSLKYYATYTAYDGHDIRPMMLETDDFLKFRMFRLIGKFARDKGMALFPRKINGKFCMISRIDNVNMFITQSDDLTQWDTVQKLKRPLPSWQQIKSGNCGSPIETKHGWLLLTHGVGAMREYSIGACLLDLKTPEKVIRQLKEPLIRPDKEERDGYVPNVVYTCGSILHNNKLIIPYASSDVTTLLATVNLEDLIQEMQSV